MTWRVLVSAPHLLPVIDRYRGRFAGFGITLTVVNVRERLEEDDLLPLIGDVDGIICGDDRFTERVLLAAVPRLRVISKWGTGIDGIDVEAARRLGVRVCNTPGAFTNPVADSVLGYILAFARRIPWATASMRSGLWEKLPSVSLGETTLGIVGVGNIGSAVARRARAFGMLVLGHDIRPISTDLIRETGLVPVSLETLLEQSDFVSVNCDLNPTSRRLIGAPEFQRMRPAAVLVNTARGPIVDHEALVVALEEGWLAGAALDVFEDEPLPADSLLRRMDNVLLAPHNANGSPRAWEMVHESTIRNLLDGLGITERTRVSE